MRIGVLGGGQLAWMLGLAAQPLGIELLCWDSQPHVTARCISQVLAGDFSDERLLQEFISQVDVVTLETENIPLLLAERIAQELPFYPSVPALAQTQDRWLEKQLFQRLGIPTPRFRAIQHYEDLVAAVDALGLPAVLKTRRLGYDGKGQYVLRQEADLPVAWQILGNHSLILEEWVVYQREVSLIAARNQQGEIRYYPLASNMHQEGILRVTEAPYEAEHLQQQAERIVAELMVALAYVGVMAVEFFQVGDELLANEIAPRVHNSGHWTIEGATTSQFSNHVRAVCNLPLGDTAARGYSMMINSIGQEPDINAVLALSGTHYYTYRKQPCPNRKLGHVTLQAEQLQHYQDSKEKLRQLFSWLP